ETQHVDGRIAWLPLHGALEGGAVPPITLHPAGPLGDLPALPAIETGDLVALLEQGPHEARADMAGATDDADFHARNPPLRWCGHTIAGSVTPKLSAMACRLLHQSHRHYRLQYIVRRALCERRSHWIPGSYAPTLSENGDSFFRPLKKKDFKE